jgi:uncharacterized protein YukE
MMGIGTLLRFQQQLVQSVLDRHTQQMNIVREQAYQPLQQIMQQVEGGVWKGTGAEAFKQELQQLHMPGLTMIEQLLQIFQKMTVHAGDVMTKADQDANHSVQGLAEDFQKIVQF